MTYCPDRYKDQIVCDEAVDDCLAVLKFISDLFVTGKMLEKFHNILLDNDDILFLNQDLNKATIFANEMGILLQTLIKLVLMMIISLKNAKQFKKDKKNY